MATFKSMSHKEIEEYINEEIENEHCSENEDFLEINDHQTDSEESGDEHVPCEESSSRISPIKYTHERQGIRRPAPDLRRPDLDCVPLSILQKGFYIGKDKTTKWSIDQPVQNTRTRSHNIITEVPGPCHEASNITTPLQANVGNFYGSTSSS